MDSMHVIAGRCSTTFDAEEHTEQYGNVLVVVKPDGTVLVHDREGYQPVAWLTRAESVTVTDDTVAARDGCQSLRVTVHEEHSRGRYPITHAGVPVGTCPDCADELIRASSGVSCPACEREYRLPTKATVMDETCPDCGLPTIRVDRGERFEVCLDRECDSLDERVRAAFDREWACPDCGGDLRIIRRRSLLLGCENYPTCEKRFSMPHGILDGECGCGLPAFETPRGKQCLDRDCETASKETLST